MPNKDYCINHPHRAAVEHCEVCGDPLCGYCLYYTDDGQRLCETHAKAAQENGLEIIPPATYSEGIIPSQAAASQVAKVREQYKPKGAAENNLPLYHGNNTDLQGFVAMGMGLLTLGTCCGGTYCFPFLAVGLGVIVLMNAKDAVDPRRARTQAWMGILSGGVLAGLMVSCIAFYIITYGAIFAAASNTSFSTPFAFPTSAFTPVPSTTHTPSPRTEPAQRTATAAAQMTLDAGSSTFNDPLPDAFAPDIALIYPTQMPSPNP